MTDFPDFTQYALIDIWTQTLARVLARPTYGGALASTGSGGVGASGKTVLFDVAGEGVFYGGYLWVDAVATQEFDMWLFYIDGNLQNMIPFNRIVENNFTQPYGGNPFCTRYDEINWQYGFCWPYGITFETGFEIKYWETHGRTPNIITGISYALV